MAFQCYTGMAHVVRNTLSLRKSLRRRRGSVTTALVTLAAGGDTIQLYPGQSEGTKKTFNLVGRKQIPNCGFSPKQRAGSQLYPKGYSHLWSPAI